MMTAKTKSLYWAAALIVLAVANALGWVTDGNATTMFAVIPALWVANTFGGRCLPKRVS